MLQSPTAHLVFLICALCLLVSGCALRRNSTLTPEKINLDVLLIAYDNGDGRAFKALLPELTAKNIHWHLIAFGPAAQLFKDSQNITILDQQVSQAEANKWFNNRRAVLPEQLTFRLVNSYEPQIVLTGMSHSAQARLMGDWWNQGAKTVAFYDNFEPVAGQKWAEPWLEIPPSVELFLVPSNNAARSFPKARQGVAQVVQHPALLQWQETIKHQDKDVLRSQLGLSEKPVVLVAGGYGKEYQQSLALIMTAARQRPDLQWLLAPHPRTDGAFEKQLLLSEPNTFTQVVSTVPTTNLAAVADLMVTYNSTSGWFTAQLGIPTLFVRPEEQARILIPERLQLVNTEVSLLNGIHRFIDRGHSTHIAPTSQPEATIIAELEKLLGKSALAIEASP